MITLLLKNSKLWIYPSIVFAIHIVATYADTYYKYLWFDSPMHLAGGAAIGFSVSCFFKLTAPKTPWWILGILIISVTALVAVGWEWMEFLLDVTSSSNHQPGLADTMKDLYFGVVGATIIALYVSVKKSRTR